MVHMNINSEQFSPFLVEIQVAQLVSYCIGCIPFPYLPGTTPSLGVKPRVLSDSVVPGEAKFAKEAGLTSWFSTVVSRAAI